MPVPRPEMIIFLPSEKELLQAERREFAIDSCNPLGHAVIVGIFGLGPKFMVFALKPICPFPRRPGKATVRRDTTEFSVSSGDHAHAGFECERRFVRVTVNHRRFCSWT